MALVGITGNDGAPRYPRAGPDGRRQAQEYWVQWWTANAQGFTPADSEVSRRAVHTWINKRQS